MARWIKTDGSEEKVSPRNGTDYSLEELKGFVDGYIEIVRFPNREELIMVVDDEGALKPSGLNINASMLARQPIYGNVLVCKDNEVR